MRGTQMKLGMAIKTARNGLKITQSELADKLNISVRYLQTIENESQTPSYAVLERIFEYLNIPSSVVFEPEEGEDSADKTELLYLINNRCSERDIEVLLATARALIVRNDSDNAVDSE